jgi:hypothetical protein
VLPIPPFGAREPWHRQPTPRNAVQLAPLFGEETSGTRTEMSSMPAMFDRVRAALRSAVNAPRCEAAPLSTEISAP